MITIVNLEYKLKRTMGRDTHTHPRSYVYKNKFCGWAHLHFKKKVQKY